jgi:hypothetical protein
MSEFTPGPWRQGNTVELLLNNKCREIISDDGNIGLVYGIIDQDNKANANLIAAAPELYRECQNAKARLESVLLNEEAAKAFNNANLDELLSLEIRMAIETIEAALKKARGE